MSETHPLLSCYCLQKLVFPHLNVDQAARLRQTCKGLATNHDLLNRRPKLCLRQERLGPERRRTQGGRYRTFPMHITSAGQLQVQKATRFTLPLELACELTRPLSGSDDNAPVERAVLRRLHRRFNLATLRFDAELLFGDGSHVPNVSWWLPLATVWPCESADKHALALCGSVAVNSSDFDVAARFEQELERARLAGGRRSDAAAQARIAQLEAALEADRRARGPGERRMAHFHLRVSGSVCDKHNRRVALGACCTPLFAVKSQIATNTMVATRAMRRPSGTTHRGPAL